MKASELDKKFDDDQEDILDYFDTLDAMISDKRIDELKAGKTEVYSLEEVAQKLGLS